MNIYINNTVDYHYEVIESSFTLLLNKLGVPDSSDNKYYLHIYPNVDYINYITTKYQNKVIIVHSKPTITFNYEIYCTFYPKEQIDYDYNFDKNQIVISHRAYPHLIGNEHIYFLSPLCKCDRFIIPSVLPEIIKVKANIPIFAVQGNITEARRNYRALLPLFETYKHIDFKIKFIGRGTLPHYLVPYMNKIQVCSNLSFTKYHESFNDVYGILTLIDDNFNHSYYTSTLTSSISYGIAYNLLFVCSQKLKDIYNLSNAVVYNDNTSMIQLFGQALNRFE